MNGLKEAVNIFGSQKELAKAIGKKQQNISFWLKKGFIPAESVIPIEKATGGKIKRHQLRPDIYPLSDPDNHLLIKGHD